MTPLLITMGDPTGIGPELIVKTLLTGDLVSLPLPVRVIGDVAALKQAGRIFGIEARDLDKGGPVCHLDFNGHLLEVEAGSRLTAASLTYGQPDHACGLAMANYIDMAAQQCLDRRAHAMVTCPINKKAINAAGFRFPGHTEFLAARCGVQQVVMMLAGTRLKVCLVTTHLPLAAVAQQLTTEAILTTLRITHKALQRQFALLQPRLAVLALNPHAGEEGLFGDEEQRLIVPAIEAACAEGIAASGPHSADTLFHFAVHENSADAVICMYHDQGLIPLKLLHFDDAVNVTLGLPIIRTSVDHGTAYDRAGSGSASTASLCAALRMAATMSPQPFNETDRKP
ncbi:MAG: 4-hydroxythreonine-4-phosphate dehydrogenase PdxA [Desulfuromonadales bacterium]|nr:4-hydroxythreonine-4-phosphate dehydrogenase PdxA [Desulfuromonadales bacterium]